MDPGAVHKHRMFLPHFVFDQILPQLSSQTAADSPSKQLNRCAIFHQKIDVLGFCPFNSPLQKSDTYKRHSTRSRKIFLKIQNCKLISKGQTVKVSCHYQVIIFEKLIMESIKKSSFSFFSWNIFISIS